MLSMPPHGTAKMLKLLVFVLSCTAVQLDDSLSRKIGAIFYKDSEELQTAFRVAAAMYNFQPLVREVQRGRVIDTRDAVCQLAKEAVLGIVDLTSGLATAHVQAVCDVLELPHVLVGKNDYCTPDWSVLNLFPSSEAYNTALESIVMSKQWSNFTILYVKGHSIDRVSQLMKMGNSSHSYTVTVRELSGTDYRDVLIDAKESGFVNFVVDCPSENLELFLWHAQQVGLMSDVHSYIILSPDLFAMDLSRYQYGGVNMTGFRLLDLSRNERMWNFTSAYNNESAVFTPSENMRTELILLHEAVLVFNRALDKITVEPKSVECDEYDSWDHGTSLLNFMRTNKIDGITRRLNFDGSGQRTDVQLDVLELTPAGNQTVGSWLDGKWTMSRPFVPSADITGELFMKNKTFKVLISTTPPYGYIKQSLHKLEGNDRFEGFTVDLIDRLSEILGFNYEFEVDNNYGSFDPETKKWNGMVQQLMEERADFCICDFTMTQERQSVLDYSAPFMSLGIGILYKQPSKQPPEMFSFMAVFSKEVWLYVMFAQVGLGILMILVGRISHKEWQNPVPCIEQPEEFSNQFSFANSVWLIIGSVMQQGSEIAPIALGPRIITSVWWFFTMVIVASYTGTLVAFLTVEKNVMPFKNVEELFHLKSIAYGAKGKGSTSQFFKDSDIRMYKDMYSVMQKNNRLLPDNDVAVEFAENTTFAAFMESTSIEYYKERHCDLTQVGPLLDSKYYGIGMNKNSEYKKYIDGALLTLKERGEIQKLKDEWWKEKRGGGKCQEKRDEDQKQLGMKNMIGAFVVLGVGCLLGLLISIIDMLWGVFKRTLKYKTSYKEELIEELKFALKFSGDVKPVRRPQSSENSSETLAGVEGEAKDELMSLRSVRSSDTHRTHHSHSSKHSSRSQSVAFARMRSHDN